MQIVGDELQSLALATYDPLNFDLLGRSAFNRYYYATFLTTRKTLAMMQSNWKGTPHAEIPNLLKTNLKKKASIQLKAQVKQGLINSAEQSRIQQSIHALGCELAELLKFAYDARVLADYEPEIPITRENNVILLKTHKITTAKEWPNRADTLCKQLLKHWRRIGLA